MTATQITEIGPLLVFPATRKVVLREHPVDLTRMEFALLLALAAEPMRVFTKEHLCVALSVRGVSTRQLDSIAVRLRHKLRRDGDRFVCNVWGVGYRLLDATASEVQP